jgi:cathepsin D
VTAGLIDGELNGIMGLAFQGIANTGALPFWQGLINQNLLTKPEFSFFLTRFVNATNAKNEEPGGVFTLGGTNATLFQGNIDFQSFTPPPGGGSFWLQTISGASHGRFKWRKCKDSPIHVTCSRHRKWQGRWHRQRQSGGH